MTQAEAQSVGVLARGLMPKSPPEQSLLLAETLAKPDDLSGADFPYATARDACKAFATMSDFISVPAILDEVRLRMGKPTREDVKRTKDAASSTARAEALARGIETRQAERARWGHELEREREIALAFCQSQTPEDLERMRLGVLGSVSTVAAESWRKQWAGKPTLACDMLVRLIHKTYGAAGVGEAVSA